MGGMFTLPGYGCKKVVLAYSGGLDTSVLLKLFTEAGVEVVTLTLDFGQQEYADQALEEAKNKALLLGASQALVEDVKLEFAEEYVKKAVWANSLYGGNYPNSTSIGRPLIAKCLVAAAHATGADAVVHGSTGKGNDQLRFETSVKALDPSLEVLAPVRDLGLSRDAEVEYALAHGVPVSQKSKYSVDANLWGRSIECGSLEDPANVPPADAFEWVSLPEEAPNTPQSIKLYFQGGVPSKIEGGEVTVEGLLQVIQSLNHLAGKHGVGVYDGMEDRVIGLKTRELYECPAAMVLLKAHFDLEKLVLTKDELDFKQHAEKAFSDLTYQGKWFTPLMQKLWHYLEASQQDVTGWVQVKLYKGTALPVARSSPYSLLQPKLSTYDSHSTFDQSKAKGFCELYALPTVVASKVKKAAFLAEGANQVQQVA